MGKDKAAALDPIITSMEGQIWDSSCDDSDQISEFFQCCVCMELFYKPVVLACGHVSCFWCVHKAMSGFRQSHCPICRNPYYHFPNVCRLLHSMLVKLYPVAYKRREKQVLEEEKKADCFSPQFNDHSATERVSPYLDHVSSERSNLGGVGHALDCDTCYDDKTTVPENYHLRDFEGNCGIPLEENTLPEDDQANGTCKQVSINDVLCVACKQLLIRPSVLNCGHVYCESCILTSKDESLKCQVCQSSHPGGFPKVCLELDHFLLEQFPEEYAYRKEALQNEGVLHRQHEGPSTCAMQTEKGHSKSSIWPIKNDFSWWHEHGSKVHIGVGCDSCGMFPIIGKRYRCLDCKEAIGFDLCEDCYDTRSKLHGRFNQHHTPEHRFEHVRSSILRNIVVRVMTERSEDDSDASIFLNDAPEESGNTDPQSDTVTRIARK